MKPDWKDAPKGFNWLAMDGDGWWFWWLNKPYWHRGGNEWAGDGYNDAEIASDHPDESGIDWDFANSTLERRP